MKTRKLIIRRCEAYDPSAIVGIRTPAWKFSNLFDIACHSMTKRLMFMVKPFRKPIGEPGVPGLQRV